MREKLIRPHRGAALVLLLSYRLEQSPHITQNCQSLLVKECLQFRHVGMKSKLAAGLTDWRNLHETRLRDRQTRGSAHSSVSTRDVVIVIRDHHIVPVVTARQKNTNECSVVAGRLRQRVNQSKSAHRRRECGGARQTAPDLLQESSA